MDNTIPLDKIIARCDEFFNSGDTAGLGEHLRSWLAEAEKKGDLAAVLSILNELAGHYRMSGCRTRGMETVDRIIHLTALPQFRNTASTGTILINAATALHSFGEISRALELYLEAYRCYEVNLEENDPRFAGLFNNMASVYAAMNDPETAEAYYLAALDILHSAGNIMDTAVTHVNIAQLGFEQELQLENAWNCFNSPSAVRDGYYAHTALKCAPAFREMGHISRADELEKRAKEIYERH